jgi:hypothetical protein
MGALVLRVGKGIDMRFRRTRFWFQGEERRGYVATSSDMQR